jgi:predicted RNase H-like HicB family nuclease
MATFIAMVRTDGGSGYTASFPDFPGCAAAAPTLDHVLAKAREAVVARIEQLLKAGQRISIPTSADAIERGDSLLLAAIEVPDDLRMSHVELAIPALSLARIDSFARRQGLTHGALLVEAVDRWARQESVLHERRGGMPDSPTLFDFDNPLELKVDTAAIESLDEAAERGREPDAGDPGSADDITAELARLFDERSETQPFGGAAEDAQKRPVRERE